MSHVWVLTRKLWRKLEAAMPKGVEVRGHPLTTAMGDEQGKEVPLEAGMECTVAPGSPEATCMPCAVVIAEDNDVFDCLVPTVFHYAFNAYVVPAQGRLYWNPEGTGTERVASMNVCYG